MPETSWFQPITDAEWPEQIADLREGFAGSLNVYRVMAHHPALLRAWQTYRDHVVVKTTLGRQRSEVVILRTGHRLDAEYEWAHHVVRGRDCDMSDDRIANLKGPIQSMSPEDALLAGAVDELMDDACLSQATLAELNPSIGPHGILDLMATVGLYSTLAFIVKTFKTPIDRNIVEALEKRPAP